MAMYPFGDHRQLLRRSREGRSRVFVRVHSRHCGRAGSGTYKGSLSRNARVATLHRSQGRTNHLFSFVFHRPPHLQIFSTVTQTICCPASTRLPSRSRVGSGSLGRSSVFWGSWKERSGGSPNGVKRPKECIVGESRRTSHVIRYTHSGHDTTSLLMLPTGC